MRGAGGALAMAVAALLVCCSADHQESEANGNEHVGERFDASGHKAQNLAHYNLVRPVREATHYGLLPYLVNRRIEYGGPYDSRRDQWSEYSGGYYGEGLPKRNFDEIDRSGLDTFVGKRNFDEIDQTSMPFPYKRFYHIYGPSNAGINAPMSSFNKKGYGNVNNMDEIDLSPFPIGSKRSQR